MSGSESTKVAIVAPGADGRAKSYARALLFRDFSGYVSTVERSNSSYGNGIESPRSKLATTEDAEDTEEHTHSGP